MTRHHSPEVSVVSLHVTVGVDQRRKKSDVGGIFGLRSEHQRRSAELYEEGIFFCRPQSRRRLFERQKLTKKRGAGGRIEVSKSFCIVLHYYLSCCILYRFILLCFVLYFCYWYSFLPCTILYLVGFCITWL